MPISKRALALLSILAAPALAEEPMSAIDWLSRSIATPAAPGTVSPGQPVSPAEPPVTDGAAAGTIRTTTLDAQSIDGMGLTPAARVGLPRTLWGPSPTDTVVRMISAETVDTVPAVQTLLLALMTAELAPPADSDPATGRLFLARVDKLLDMGALDPALAMLDLPDTPLPEVFRRWFDVALLLGEEDRACETMRKSPQIAPAFPALIFCLARGGDWNAAALSLRTGEALGQIDADTAALLSRFLDPDLYEGEPDLPAPSRPSPLILRLMEAIGQPVPTTRLPLAFAHADLRPTTPWKARLEAGERLARTGAIDPNALLGLYTERAPAASGGVWDRVRAVQDFDAAIAAGDPGAVARTLPIVWERMKGVELEVPFATLYGGVLSRLALDGAAGEIAFEVGLLSPDYEAVARTHKPHDGTEAFLAALAQGRPSGVTPPDQLGAALAAAFAPDVALPDDQAQRLAEHRAGEAILQAIDEVTRGATGDLRDVTAGLAVFRKVGLESTARRAALELMLLERRG